MGQTIAEYYMEQGYARGLVEGRAEEARRILLRVGEHLFGKPSQETVTAVNAIDDVDRLERLTDQLLQANSWQEILDTPSDGTICCWRVDLDNVAHWPRNER